MKWFLLVCAILWILFLLTHVKIVIQYKKSEENDHIHLELQFLFGFIVLKFDIPVLKITSLLEGAPVKMKTSSEASAQEKTEPGQAQGGFFLTPRKVKRFLEFMNQIKLRAHDLQEVAKFVLSKFKCERFEWYTRVGVGDAASTAMVTGLFWGVKTTLVGAITRYIALRTTPRINVVPAYYTTEMDTRFLCIFRYRIGNSIIAVVRILFKLIKGREGIWQNTLFRA
ncbi:DUF2953 domain-containing protein [Ammoniphilus sp. 3BR4]|uniref:DUF2953 domain-containing protein n=1 Tax=Ammoniphilus sp. 3BR4 TaxID=3158265 RepID=UPI003465DE52